MRGARWLIAGLVLLLVALLGSVGLASEMSGRFGGNAVHIRPFMAVYGGVLGATHALCLTLVLTGILRLEVEATATRGAALALFGLATSWVGLGLVFPLALGSGPWAPDSVEVVLLRHLTMGPALVRAVGMLLVLVALRPLWRGVPRPVLSGVALCLAADVAVCAWQWWATPFAVVARLHPMAAEPIGLVPMALGSAALVGLLTHSASRGERAGA